jgi:hypothetical protein
VLIEELRAILDSIRIDGTQIAYNDVCAPAIDEIRYETVGSP